MDPDPGGPKTCGSGGCGSGSATLTSIYHNENEDKKKPYKSIQNGELEQI